MNDQEARRLLEGIDRPRPLPSEVREQILTMAGIDAARPMPEELRRRIEAAVSPRRRPSFVAIASAAATVLLLAGGVLATTRRGGTTTHTETASAPAARVAPAQLDARPGAGAGAPSMAAPSAAAQAVVGMVGDPSSDVAAGFTAYMRRAGITVVAGDAGVATVNVGVTPWTGAHRGLLFETVFVAQAQLDDDVASLASTVEAQARAAVDAAGRMKTAAVYSSSGAPWSAAAQALTDALRARGVAVVGDGGDAAFLALSPAEVPGWLRAHGTPPLGIWAIGSAYDDRLAAGAIRVASPYAPPADQDALRTVLPDGVLTAAAVHGWETAKAVADLVRRNGARPITAGDVPAPRPPVLLEPVNGRFEPSKR